MSSTGLRKASQRAQIVFDPSDGGRSCVFCKASDPMLKYEYSEWPCASCTVPKGVLLRIAAAVVTCHYGNSIAVVLKDRALDV